jgi:hypothetical protein
MKAPRGAKIPFGAFLNCKNKLPERKTMAKFKWITIFLAILFMSQPVYADNLQVRGIWM